MRKLDGLAFLILPFFLPSLASAQIDSIHANALPQEAAVLSALDDARQLEPYSLYWTAEQLWQFDIPRQKVADRLSVDLGILKESVNAHPENAELTILAALVANHSHNLEVNGAYDTAMKMLETAGKLAPGDLRVNWFRATLHCQSTEIEEGARGFLVLESGAGADRLPAGFWDDYMECALLSNMPAHVLRAASYLEKSHVSQSDRGKAYVGFARERLVPFDPQKEYEPSAVFLGYDDGNDEVLTGASFGAKMRVHATWEKSGFKLKGNRGTTLFLSGPYAAKKGTLKPSILLLAQQAKPGQTLEEFSASFDRSHGTFAQDVPNLCPAQRCMAERGVEPGLYRENGDGHTWIIVFEREQPEFPGLIFESPSALPHKEGKKGPESFRFAPIQQRMPGKLFYLVMLDTAVSIEEPALKDFDFFLKNLTVE